MKLDDLWQQQFKNDFPESSTEEQAGLSREDQRFLELVNSSVKQVDGHYQLSLPLRTKDVSMPNNMKVAEQRLCSLKRRFLRDPCCGTGKPQQGSFSKQSCRSNKI